MQIAGTKARFLAQRLLSSQVCQSTPLHARSLTASSERVYRSLEEASTSEQPIKVRKGQLHW